MRLIISALVAISFAMIRCQLCTLGIEQADELHHKGRSSHLLRVLIEESEDVSLVVRDE